MCVDKREIKVIYMKPDIFTTASQEAQKLSIALEEYFHREILSEKEKDACRRYLRLRKRPAVMKIIENQDCTALKGFIEEGWMDERLLGEALTLAGEQKNVELLAVLFTFQKQTGIVCRMEEIYGEFE